MNKPDFWQTTRAVLHRVFLALFYILLRSTVGLYCRIRFRPRYIRPKEVRRLRTPYVVLADHVHPMDMFINGLGIRPVIHWVAADANFRTPFMKFVMTVLAGAVAKSKNRSDMVTLSKLRLLTGIGSVIGVYQEGERSWDGVGLPPVPGTDKLIRFLKVPVVYAHLQGAFLEHPRWKWKGNRTRISVRYEVLIRPDEAGALPLSEISRRITAASGYNEWTYQKEAAVPLKANRRAEHVELVCFLCPGCRSVNTLKSAGNEFACQSCGCSGSVNILGGFDWSVSPEKWPEGRPFENVRDWTLWQLNHYGEQIADSSLNPGEVLFWEDLDTVHLTRGKRNRKPEDLGVGTARFYGDRIEFESDRISLSMPLESITSFSVFRQYYTEFYHNQLLHRFTFTSRSVSGYKWLMLFRLTSDCSENMR